MLAGALCMIYGGIYSDIADLVIGVMMLFRQRGRGGPLSRKKPDDAPEAASSNYVYRNGMP